MREVRVVSVYLLPEPEDLQGRRYAPWIGMLADPIGRDIFARIMNEHAFAQCRLAVDVFGRPAIAGVAAALVAAFPHRLGLRHRQFAGVCVDLLMRSNDYAPTGRSRSIGVRPFSRGRMYARVAEADGAA